MNAMNPQHENAQALTSMSMIQACSSQCAIAIPLVAPLPASPTMCSEPMFDASSEQPTTNQPISRPARK